MAEIGNEAPKIKKLDEVVINRIAAGEIIQRPANALKELIENSLDAKATNIQIVTKEGGLKLLQIQDNGTGIRKEDMEIVCERFTTSKLHKFEDLTSIATFGFRGEALASISHIALLTITTKTANEKCAYKASYIDSKLKAPPKSCAGNQGTTIVIENLFYNCPTRRKALCNTADEYTKITDVVMKYAVHNPTVGFVLKKHGDMTPQVRTPHNSTKMNNVRILYGNSVSRELLEVELTDDIHKFKLHALVTNPNYSNKRMVLLLFINNRLVESSNIRKMLEDLYSIYLPKKSHPWCYLSLYINPENIDVNVHPTKQEVKFLHEDSIIDKVKYALDEKLSNNSTSKTFYVQSRLPQVDVTRKILEEVLPEYDKSNADKTKKIVPMQMVRTDSSDQKLDKFNFTIELNNAKKTAGNNEDASSPVSVAEKMASTSKEQVINKNTAEDLDIGQGTAKKQKTNEITENEITMGNNDETSWDNILDDSTSGSSLAASAKSDKLSDALASDNVEDFLKNIRAEFPESSVNKSVGEVCRDKIADEARKKVYKYFGSQGSSDSEKKVDNDAESNKSEINKPDNNEKSKEEKVENTQSTTTTNESEASSQQSSRSGYKSYSVNTFRREVKLTSILKLRIEVENDCHEGLQQILADSTFVGCVNTRYSLIQSGVNLYLCNIQRLAEEFFYELMLYEFANYGIIKFSEPVPLYDLALLGLNTKEAGWTEEDGEKTELARSVKELLLEKADMMKEYFSIVIDKRGNLKSLPILLHKYFPDVGGLPLYVLRLATEVEWSTEQPCFRTICRETAKYYSILNPTHDTRDWKYITEHLLYPEIKESLVPRKHFAHDATIVQIASLPELYKVFERC